VTDTFLGYKGSKGGATERKRKTRERMGARAGGATVQTYKSHSQRKSGLRVRMRGRVEEKTIV